jgi:hypothetical protein
MAVAMFHARAHLAASGFNLARKVAMCCEFFKVRTAWHEPTNAFPIGHAVNLHSRDDTPTTARVGIDIDEKLVTKYPMTTQGSNRGARDRDGGPPRP